MPVTRHNNVDRHEAGVIWHGGGHRISPAARKLPSTILAIRTAIVLARINHVEHGDVPDEEPCAFFTEEDAAAPMTA